MHVQGLALRLPAHTFQFQGGCVVDWTTHCAVPLAGVLSHVTNSDVMNGNGDGGDVTAELAVEPWPVSIKATFIRIIPLEKRGEGGGREEREEVNHVSNGYVYSTQCHTCTIASSRITAQTRQLLVATVPRETRERFPCPLTLKCGQTIWGSGD